ncbi:hypothetical protein HZC09_06650 [Candidatus Micrarchaeota archaeon]|nr:hypothetical protein [Candidatus Micrarchaeota archaeon]
MKTQCSFCDEVTECSCPDHSFHAHPDAKTLCPVCGILLEMGVKEEELKATPKRAEVKHMMKVEEIVGTIVGETAEINFGKLWQGEKDELRPLSKKDLAEAFFYRSLEAGIYPFVDGLLDDELDRMIERIRAKENAP